jgi:hypothetical protein
VTALRELTGGRADLLAGLAGFLEGLDLVDPGLVAAQNRRGGWPDAPAAPARPGVRARRGNQEGAGFVVIYA